MLEVVNALKERAVDVGRRHAVVGPLLRSVQRVRDITQAADRGRSLHAVIVAQPKIGWRKRSRTSTMRYLDAETAQWVAAEQVLAALPLPDDDAFVITGCERVGQTWVVHWNTRRSMETGSLPFVVEDTGPALVSDRYEVAQANAMLPLTEAVAMFERRP